MKNKKIVIAGGTGFMGRTIARHLAADNEVVILSRNTPNAPNNAFAPLSKNTHIAKDARVIYWNGIDCDDWITEIDGADLVINLAGRSVNCRYNARNRQQILDSRVLSTKAIGAAIAAATVPPKVWINASSATIYRHSTDCAQDEFTGEIHNDFSVQVCKKWEQAFFETRTPQTRKIAFRTAITLGTGGVMAPYLNLVKFGLGGRQGSGRQMYSWVHIEDVCRAIEFVFDETGMEGVYNLSAPNPLSNKEFMATLRKAAGCRWGLPAYEWMLAIGAAVIGTETELILKSRYVVPARLTKAGFVFKFQTLKEAIGDIINSIPPHKYKLL